MDAADLERWRLADLEFERLLELDADARAARLRELEAGDQTLHACVQRLFEAHRTGGGALDRPCLPMPAAVPDALSGRRLGRWQLEHEIGRGGMSVVYRARALEGAAGRDAAVKILTLGTLAGDGGKRFVREQAVLVRLRHPYIVPLYDAGVADDGTPWLAMARVEGTPIDAWCDAHELDERDRVRLLLQVCDAVAHAHRNLVIHRDIKPSNVLVDDDGCARLLDFGIAAQVGPGTERTATAMCALTPEYAAPEQFDGVPAATTMDVYGIGALLHRLLTGVPPAGRVVGPAAPAPSRLAVRGLRGDLDAIVRKAIADEPDARYASVDALADDLKRWLDGRPVHARPPSLRYRLRRFVARNRVATAASLALLLAVGGGIAATVWQARQAQREAERAVATRDFLVRILESADPTTTQGRDPPASELLRKGAAQIVTELSGRPQLRADLLLVIGRTQLARGLVADAASSLDRALALFADGTLADDRALAATLSERAMVSYEQGDLDTAVKQLQRADALLEAIEHGAAYSPQRERTRGRLADLLVVALFRTEDGAAVARDLIEHLRRSGRTGSMEYPRALRVLGAAADMEGRSDEAIDWLLQGERALRDHAGVGDEQATLYNELGIAYLHAGRLREAEEALQRALDLQRKLFGERHPATLNTRGNLAGLYLNHGRARDALSEYEQILQLQREVVGTGPHPSVATDLGWLALARYRNGSVEQALASAEAGWRMVQELPAADRVAVQWLAPLVGLLRLERQQEDPELLLREGGIGCDTLSTTSTLSRWTCIARAWQARRTDGACGLPQSSPPVSPEGMDATDRRWWTAYWVLRAECGGPDSRAGAARAIALFADAGTPLPPWLAQHLDAAMRNRS